MKKVMTCRSGLDERNRSNIEKKKARIKRRQRQRGGREEKKQDGKCNRKREMKIHIDFIVMVYEQNIVEK
jgi:hypothetical protein